VPMGVARLNLGGWALGIDNGGSAGLSSIGGAAALLTGLWLGDAGIARPSRGSLFADPARPAPGTGGRSSGTGDAILALWVFAHSWCP
jgi:hypothetical protein